MSWYAEIRKIPQLQNQNSPWNHLSFLNETRSTVFVQKNSSLNVIFRGKFYENFIVPGIYCFENTKREFLAAACRVQAYI